MILTAEKTYTSKDLLSNPDLDGYELVNGHLKERPVSKRSSLVGGRILFLLFQEADKTREARVYPSDLGYQCFPDSENTVRFADVSVVRAERDGEAGDDPGFMPIPADLVVEVLSPNDRIKEVEDKVDQYLRAGFGMVWVVNPHRRNVQVHRLGARGVQLLGEQDEITVGPALPGFRCLVAEFFNV